MGMFDTMTLAVELPSLTVTSEEFQTKDLACNLDQYRVTPDGRVMKKEFIDDAYNQFRWVSANLTASDVRLRNAGVLQLSADFMQGRLTRLDEVQ